MIILLTGETGAVNTAPHKALIPAIRKMVVDGKTTAVISEAMYNAHIDTFLKAFDLVVVFTKDLAKKRDPRVVWEGSEKRLFGYSCSAFFGDEVAKIIMKQGHSMKAIQYYDPIMDSHWPANSVKRPILRPYEEMTLNGWKRKGNSFSQDGKPTRTLWEYKKPVKKKKVKEEPISLIDSIALA